MYKYGAIHCHRKRAPAEGGDEDYGPAELAALDQLVPADDDLHDGLDYVHCGFVEGESRWISCHFRQIISKFPANFGHFNCLTREHFFNFLQFSLNF